ncbi:unnamed protein product [Gemmataceae bacterium]|nr:unnamed protein product [Gemmataceae bacterium]VTT99076.1 unnamed protein product [Gemmataceae bacterium]
MEHFQHARNYAPPVLPLEDRERFRLYAAHYGDDDSIRPATPTRPTAAPPAARPFAAVAALFAEVAGAHRNLSAAVADLLTGGRANG